ncbi:MAG: M48 family metalloprotease [Armatimonadota bacterium]|jgi:Zn-dependent protease with chaperone function
MRLRSSDYRHPAEPATFVASAWLAITLLVLAEALMLSLVIFRPLYAPASVALGIVLLVAFHLGLVWGLVAIRAHRDGLRRSGRRIGPTRHARVHEAAETACARLAAPGTPPIYVIPVREVDSFTIAWGVPEIFVTEGMVRSLGDLELRAALAHELAHLKSRHTRWLTLIRLPLAARLAPTLLLASFALAWLGMRWWAEVAELTADRASAIAVGGPEPVAGWLSAAIGRSQSAPAEIGLHRYLTHGAHEPAWEVAEEELHAIAPAVAQRIVKLAQFTASSKFTVCLGIIGDLNLPTVERRPDPASAGVMPQVLIGVLAGLWLAPVAVWLTIAISAPPPQRAAVPVPPPVESFDPEMEPQTRGAAPAQTPAPPAGSLTGAGAVEGMLELARMHKDREEYDQALRVLQDLMQIDPTIAEAHYLLAWTWIGLDEREKAVAEFTATLNLTQPGDEMHQEAQAALERMQ